MRGRSTLIAVVMWTLAACGPSAKPAVNNAGGGGGGGGGGGTVSTLEPGAAVTPQSVCSRIMELKDSGCELTAGYTLTRAECEEDFGKALEERGDAARDATVANARCLLDNGSCQAISKCMEDLLSSQAPGDLRECSQTDQYAPVGRPRAEWEQRKGANARHFGDVPSTKEEPIEVCGIPAEMEWLTAVTCADGSQPVPASAPGDSGTPVWDFDHAHAARVGNVGPGGLCGSIIDLYEVPCPEGTYQVYMDAYVCPKP